MTQLEDLVVTDTELANDYNRVMTENFSLHDEIDALKRDLNRALDERDKALERASWWKGQSEKAAVYVERIQGKKQAKYVAELEKSLSKCKERLRSHPAEADARMIGKLTRKVNELTGAIPSE